MQGVDKQIGFAKSHVKVSSIVSYTVIKEQMCSTTVFKRSFAHAVRRALIHLTLLRTHLLKKRTKEDH